MACLWCTAALLEVSPSGPSQVWQASCWNLSRHHKDANILHFLQNCERAQPRWPIATRHRMLTNKQPPQAALPVPAAPAVLAAGIPVSCDRKFVCRKHLASRFLSTGSARCAIGTEGSCKPPQAACTESALCLCRCSRMCSQSRSLSCSSRQDQPRRTSWLPRSWSASSTLSSLCQS